ncbi:MAG TPA: hypothetical protein VKR06_23135 [Ktedonosporobacter sp.]|nr:hypothetical protein [Ktedonosporobacter sp.]
MPITRRRRANPPDQPEENNNHLADQAENAGEVLASEQPAEKPAEAENTAPSVTPEIAAPETVENISSYQPIVSPPSLPPSLLGNGDRGARPEYTPPIEGGRRTARGELFRRPPQPPVTPPVTPPAAPAAALQAPSHEIKLPLGTKPGDTTGDPLHLAYNPGYTGAEEVRSTLLHRLASESKHGGRARCWSCGSLAIVYECWNTRNKTFGEVGVAFCEICGVWSVL